MYMATEKQECSLCGTEQEWTLQADTEAILVFSRIGKSVHDCEGLGERGVEQTLDIEPHTHGFFARADPGEAPDGTILLQSSSTPRRRETFSR